MRAPVLHYVHDPLCGWCYGAAPLVRAARERVAVHAHAGGMLAGDQRRRVTPAWRTYVLPHDERIAHLTGQTFGERYRDGLLRNEAAVFDSEPPITAMLAADALADRGLDMLARLQVAHYVEGREIAKPEVLCSIAADIGLDVVAFAQAFDGAQGVPTHRHIAESRALLHRVGGIGFPTFVLEANGAWRLLDISRFLGRVESWREWLDGELRGEVIRRT